MDIILKLVNVAFFLLLLTWVLLELLKQRRDFGDEQLKNGAKTYRRRYTVFAKITILTNVAISIFYVGFCGYEFWNSRTIPFVSAFSSLTWILASVVAAYSGRKTVGAYKRWPLVLIFWWVFSSIWDLFLVSVSLMTYFTSIKIPNDLPIANNLDFASFPFFILLCFNALPINSSKENNDIEHPFLQEEEDIILKDADAFSNAGIWSQLTFQWLNPLFKKGRTGKLEFPHIPSIPPSQTASVASSLLEESLRKQKTGTFSLPRAVVHDIWRPLAKTGVLAGVNTVASYMGPLLITSFVNFLTGKHDHSSHQHGFILAFMFFFAKTVESLSQRQWYFGAQSIGIRVRAALMALIYKKSVSIKFGDC